MKERFGALLCWIWELFQPFIAKIKKIVKMIMVQIKKKMVYDCNMLINARMKKEASNIQRCTAGQIKRRNKVISRYSKMVTTNSIWEKHGP